MGGVAPAAPAALLFDLDETLIPDAEAVRGAMVEAGREAAERYGIDPAALADRVLKHAGELWRASPLHPWCHRIGISASEGLCGGFEGEGPELLALREFVRTYRRDAWGRALLELGVPGGPLVPALSAAFIAEQKGRRRPYPDTVPALEALSKRHRFALVTNGASDLQREKLRNSGLERWFEVVAVSGEVGFGKPAREIFDWTLARLGVPADRAAMVGDNLDRDLAGARASGVRPIWCDRAGRGEGSPVPGLERIRSLLDLPGALR